jgi:hypothetical protein
MQGIVRARLHMEPAIRYCHVIAGKLDDLREVPDEQLHVASRESSHKKYKYALFFAPSTNSVILQTLSSTSHPLTIIQSNQILYTAIRQPANNTSQLQWVLSRKRSWSAALSLSTNISNTNTNAKMLANSKFNTTATVGHRSMVLPA